MTWKTGTQLAQEYHQYERRHHPMEMWQALHRKMRFYHVDFGPTLGENEIGINLYDEQHLYPATAEGIREAINDIEYTFHNDIL